MRNDDDNRIVMTLDAGGTNFVFSAVRANKEIITPMTLPSNAHNLDLCLSTIIKGFNKIADCLPCKPVAISFAFPGPADYPNGIIGDLGNLPAFRGGIALGPMLEDKFDIPVFINNDGDLFTYGEAIAGLLPYINNKLKLHGSAKKYRNLLGITLGTGFGGGLVHDGELYLGDNAAAAEIWAVRNKIAPASFAEEGASIRAVTRVYNRETKVKHTEELSPKDIFDIAEGNMNGDKRAALEAFRELGEVAGDALANTVTITDCIIVIGGGLSKAYKYFMPELLKQLNGTINSLDGKKVNRLEMKAYNLEDEKEMNIFICGEEKVICVPFSYKKIKYDSMKRIGAGISKLGTGLAVSIGAYAFALNKLDKFKKVL